MSEESGERDALAEAAEPTKSGRERVVALLRHAFMARARAYVLRQYGPRWLADARQRAAERIRIDTGGMGGEWLAVVLEIWEEWALCSVAANPASLHPAALEAGAAAMAYPLRREVVDGRVPTALEEALARLRGLEVESAAAVSAVRGTGEVVEHLRATELATAADPSVRDAVARVRIPREVAAVLLESAPPPTRERGRGRGLVRTVGEVVDAAMPDDPLEARDQVIVGVLRDFLPKPLTAAQVRKKMEESRRLRNADPSN